VEEEEEDDEEAEAEEGDEQDETSEQRNGPGRGTSASVGGADSTPAASSPVTAICTQSSPVPASERYRHPVRVAFEALTDNEGFLPPRLVQVVCRYLGDW